MPVFNALAKPLIKTPLPMGPSGLLTVPGRKSGVPRTTPVAVIDYQGRRWVWAPWGEVDWVKNLRAAGKATVTIRTRKQEVKARELDEEQRRTFFREVMGAQARRAKGLGFLFFRMADGVDLHQPDEIAKDRPVFELTPNGGQSA
jgi:deazaflavin-dependent oxidoreductase (nitroreductase family)